MNDLTDELKISLDKLNDTEKELKAVNAAHAKLQAMPNPSPTCEPAGETMVLCCCCCCCRLLLACWCKAGDGERAYGSAGTTDT